MTTPAITHELVEQHVTLEEYEKIKEILGREPNFTELGIFSVMWSEHCSYKSSRIHLKRLPTTGERVIVPPGENAGVVDIGDDWCVAFKVESHNHPSFIEPFQGAATGVGGILRDVFTMGARPIAAMNSLRFGPLEPNERGSTTRKVANRNKSILKGVVEGIGFYGNCFGVPTVGGEVIFDEAYNLNPLVNAFALGLVRKDQIFFGKASGIGNPVLYVGAKTGRDGIHGATMASAEFDDEALEKRPTVQVGDPFLEKLLLEACLEAMRSGAIEGIQDMGAAGLTSSSVEMADRAGTGLELDLTLVPQRETGMTAYEMLLSESQERMLIVAKSGRERELVEIFNKWDLDAVVIGKVVEGNRLKVFHNGDLMADLPVDKLTDEAPRYDRPQEAPQYSKVSREDKKEKWLARAAEAGHGSNDVAEVLKTLLSSPDICSKHWVYEQYDHMVRTNTAILPGADAAVVRVKETRRAISMCLDGNGLYCAVNPLEGAKLTVAEAARNNVCVGAEPIAVTNCLNFASPERPKIMWAFSQTIDGMRAACETFETPVISGNVSFYNETDGDGVLPTPTIGMVGLVKDVRKIVTQGFKNEGDVIALLGTTNDDLSVSEYSQAVLGFSTNELIEIGSVPLLDLSLEKKVQDTCLKLADELLINSAHDCSEGGLAVAVTESCFSSLNNAPDGASLELSSNGLSPEAVLFSESPSRIVISFAPEHLDRARSIAEGLGCPFEVIGKVEGSDLAIKIDGTESIRMPVSEFESAWKNSLESHLDA
ncbi:MAG: phosphoribosylformylglycinamidine synthase subunit PurL [Acidobacteria bacterium]|nr:MAG: phosphoribosylformylglycinamidine synthase subunit PurL [Acidobacteriota bacterium]REJ99224.1 MAG: phosphoribosylformylglycinamidine synthase subunit PurL [Acidobacteriota bacterium]REK16055.1 MAG: phosphoribosylformylglycinamidine synthase subunit PurL [Acidobacteriota bacterium]REK43736.1 MAG: phosphoribosylformylglycinamidine synthase subunit PurL [Acidobacteriota bacterium]